MPWGYWSFNPADPYAAAEGNLDATVAFRYAPPVAVLFLPLHALPWPVFITGWTLLLVGAVVWLGRGWGLASSRSTRWRLEVAYGNVSLLLAIAIAAGFRYPALWSLVLLTKITPGIGLFWFVVRREWRQSRHRPRATLALALLSYAVAPDLWPAWIRLRSRTRRRCRTPARSASLPRWAPVRGGVWIVTWGALTTRRGPCDRCRQSRHRSRGCSPPVMLGALRSSGVGPISPQVASRCHSRTTTPR